MGHSEGMQWLVWHGQVQPSVVTQRVSLLPDCSLLITDVTIEDAENAYTCWQLSREGGTRQGYDAAIHLTVLYGRLT